MRNQGRLRIDEASASAVGPSGVSLDMRRAQDWKTRWKRVFQPSVKSQRRVPPCVPTERSHWPPRSPRRPWRCFRSFPRALSRHRTIGSHSGLQQPAIRSWRLRINKFSHFKFKWINASGTMGFSYAQATLFLYRGPATPASSNALPRRRPRCAMPLPTNTVKHASARGLPGATALKPTSAILHTTLRRCSNCDA